MVAGDFAPLAPPLEPPPRRVELRNLVTGAVQSWQDIQTFSFAGTSSHLILRRRAPEMFRPGAIVDRRGSVVGTHAGVAALVLLCVGGLFYTLGAVFYAVKWPNHWPETFGYHEYFHACTVLAAVSHYIAIWLAMYA